MGREAGANASFGGPGSTFWFDRSASSVLAEAIRDGTAPAALILQESDEIIVLGAIVADEIYQTVMPILLVDDATYRDVASLTAAQIRADGQIDPR